MILLLIKYYIFNNLNYCFETINDIESIDNGKQMANIIGIYKTYNKTKLDEIKYFHILENIDIKEKIYTITDEIDLIMKRIYFSPDSCIYFNKRNLYYFEIQSPEYENTGDRYYCSGFLLNCKLHGELNMIFKQDDLKNKYFYKDGIKNGPYSEYINTHIEGYFNEFHYEETPYTETGIFVNDLKQGECFFNYENCIETGYYIDGKLNCNYINHFKVIEHPESEVIEKGIYVNEEKQNIQKELLFKS